MASKIYPIGHRSPDLAFYPTGSLRLVIREARDMSAFSARAMWVFQISDRLFAAAPALPSGHVFVCQTVGHEVTIWNRHHVPRPTKNWWDEDLDGWAVR